MPLGGDVRLRLIRLTQAGLIHSGPSVEQPGLHERLIAIGFPVCRLSSLILRILFEAQGFFQEECNHKR